MTEATPDQAPNDAAVEDDAAVPAQPEAPEDTDVADDTGADSDDQDSDDVAPDEGEDARGPGVIRGGNEAPNVPVQPIQPDGDEG